MLNYLPPHGNLKKIPFSPLPRKITHGAISMLLSVIVMGLKIINLLFLKTLR